VQNKSPNQGITFKERDRAALLTAPLKIHLIHLKIS
jgi:hypothetical protein